MHGANSVVGAHDGPEEAAFEFEALNIFFEGDVNGLRAEVADDDDRWCDC